MLKKIILPVIMLVFVQQELYGMKDDGKYEQPANGNENLPVKHKKNIWESINNWVNGATKNDRPKLWWLWGFVDNVQLQYGGSKIWEHGEAYYGLSNGIGFFPSFLNFGWMKIGIIDLHIDLIIDIIHFCRNNVWWKVNHDGYGNVLMPLLFYDLLGQGTHFLSFKMFNGIKIRLISISWDIFMWVKEYIENYLFNTKDITQSSWYYDWRNSDGNNMAVLYLALCPRIEINIPELINYFKGC